jgi:hypothetical protein
MLSRRVLDLTRVGIWVGGNFVRKRGVTVYAREDLE